MPVKDKGIDVSKSELDSMREELRTQVNVLNNKIHHVQDYAKTLTSKVVTAELSAAIEAGLRDIDRRRDGISGEIYAHVLSRARREFDQKASELQELAKQNTRISWVALVIGLTALAIGVYAIQSRVL